MFNYTANTHIDGERGAYYANERLAQLERERLQREVTEYHQLRRIEGPPPFEPRGYEFTRYWFS